jgi:hypothetical protein
MTDVRDRVVAGAIALALGLTCLAACSTEPTVVEMTPCTNGARDEGEVGVDCGGLCPTRCTGTSCTANEECKSGTCALSACTAPSGKACGVGTAVATCADGETCELDRDCASGFCNAATCATPSAESHSDGQINGGETGVDCGGSIKASKPCGDGQKCIDSSDCVGTCTGNVCGPVGPTDGKKNNGEVDVDCGGPNAPKCAVGKACTGNVDCADNYCPDATKKCTAPRYDDGIQNGSETDVDCGGNGAGFKPCAQDKSCNVDTDCTAACTYKKKCVDTPSCKNQHGGDTCGTGELGAGGEVHESCCKSLEVAGYTDASMPAGKTKVYLDKYEITAGRMRAFLEAVGGGVDAAGNAKSPNVKAYMAAHRPSRWNNGWEEILPSANAGATVTYTIKNATTDLLNAGQDQYLLNHWVQDTWWIGGPAGPQPEGTSVDYTIDTGLFHALGAAHFFAEYYADPTKWLEGPGHAASHALNCSNEDGSYGYPTYWFDKATTIANSGGTQGKYFSKAQLDEKSLNCTPNALFAAFCAWDGGQLATAEVIDNVTENTVSPIFDDGACQGGAACQNGKLAVGKSTCGLSGTHTLITYPNANTTPCSDVYYYPNDNGNDSHDGSSRVAAPGRVPADAIAKNPGDEAWMDLIGNLQEAVLAKAETTRFDYRGYGGGWYSAQNHHNQQTTPRHKSGAFGARCMRFK